MEIDLSALKKSTSSRLTSVLDMDASFSKSLDTIPVKLSIEEPISDTSKTSNEKPKTVGESTLRKSRDQKANQEAVNNNSHSNSMKDGLSGKKSESLKSTMNSEGKSNLFNKESPSQQTEERVKALGDTSPTRSQNDDKDLHHTVEKEKEEKKKLEENKIENSQVNWYEESESALEKGRQGLEDVNREKDAVMKTTRYQLTKNYLPKILNEFQSIPYFEDLDAYKVFHNYPDSIPSSLWEGIVNKLKDLPPPRQENAMMEYIKGAQDSYKTSKAHELENYKLVSARTMTDLNSLICKAFNQMKDKDRMLEKQQLSFSSLVDTQHKLWMEMKGKNVEIQKEKTGLEISAKADSLFKKKTPPPEFPENDKFTLKIPGITGSFVIDCGGTVEFTITDYESFWTQDFKNRLDKWLMVFAKYPIYCKDYLTASGMSWMYLMSQNNYPETKSGLLGEIQLAIRYKREIDEKKKLKAKSQGDK